MGEDSRTLQSEAVSRKENQSTAFDLMSWQGLTKVLSAAKKAGLSNDEHNHLRDLVLAYSQNGGDKTIKKEIDAVLATFPTKNTEESKPEVSDVVSTKATEKESVKKAASATNKQSEPVTAASIGASRLAPQFAPVTVTKESPVEKLPVSSPVVEGGVSTKEKAAVSETSEEKPKTAVPEPEKVAPVTPPVVEESVVTSIPTPEPVKVPVIDEVSPPTPERTIKTMEEHKLRITEIKQLVNSQYGNPITLIDQGNPVGRNYMTALLTAMKATAGGPAGSLAAAMVKLEEAYAALGNSAVAAQTVSAPPAPEPVPEPTPQKEQEILEQPATVPVQEKAPVQEPEVKKVVPVPEPAPAEPETQNPESSTDVADSVQAAAPAEEAPAVPEKPMQKNAIPSLGSTLDEMPLAHVEELVTPEVDEEALEAARKKQEALEAELAAKLPKKKEDISDIKNVIAGLTDSTTKEVESILKQKNEKPTEESKEEKKLEPEVPRVPVEKTEIPEPVVVPAPPEQAVEKEVKPIIEQTTSVEAVDQKKTIPQPPVTPVASKAAAAPIKVVTKKTPFRTSLAEKMLSLAKNKTPEVTSENVSKNAVSVDGPESAPAVDVPDTVRSENPMVQSKGLGLEKKEILQMTKRAQVNQSELISPEITAGLGQLLDEWEHFKHSGMFGTGPSGLEHPLYQKIALLSMSSVMAGRWEGVTPEVVQSIKDYVNAWRHEQGITYDPGETFEHYLKRVVQRILKRQNGA